MGRSILYKKLYIINVTIIVLLFIAALIWILADFTTAIVDTEFGTLDFEGVVVSKAADTIPPRLAIGMVAWFVLVSVVSFVMDKIAAKKLLAAQYIISSQCNPEGFLQEIKKLNHTEDTNVLICLWLATAFFGMGEFEKAKKALDDIGELKITRLTADTHIEKMFLYTTIAVEEKNLEQAEKYLIQMVDLFEKFKKSFSKSQQNTFIIKFFCVDNC